ncbi:MAG: hypothetical protein DME74_11175 [Verrucomicrobia bacterium]|nr:MAG: hypothetical protein DME74_11175 [Verrucomicrobiota bacterium]
MRRKLLIAILVCSLAGTATAPGREPIRKGDVAAVPLRGEVAPAMLAFLRRAVKTAESNEASAIVFEMNTYGGRLDTAADIVNALNQTKIPTYTFINTNAGSAGAIIAIATQHIFMAPVSAIGAAVPILPTGEDLPATAKEKTISYWSALVRGSAIKNGHNPDIAEAFMNKDKEVKIGDRVVHPKGAVLSLNAQEATERINGKPLLAEGRLLDHCACAAAASRWNPRCVSRVQDSRRDMAWNHLCNLFRALFSGALSGRSGRLGSRRALHSRNGSRFNRNTFLRAYNNRIRRPRRVSHACLTALDDDRPLSGRQLSPDGRDAGDAAA